MTTVETVLATLGIVQVAATLLATVLPPEWAVTHWCARIGAALPARWRVTPAPQSPSPPALPVGMLAFGLLATSCSFSLGAARASGRPLEFTAAAPMSSTCEAIDREHSAATLAAGILGGLAGASGLAAIPVHDDGARGALMSGAAVSGIGATSMALWSQERAERFSKVCQ